MKPLKSPILAMASATFLLVCCLHVFAQPFTYQGMLKEKGVPADGVYDFVFHLYEFPSGISRPIGTITVDDQKVTSGLFTVSLDFGAVWNGNDRYLEIGVRSGNSTGSYTILSPRVRVNYAPCSILSLSSQSVPWSGITGVPSSFPPGGPAGGDLSGTYPTPSVVGIWRRPVANVAPGLGQVLKWDGSAWSPAADLQDAYWQASGTDIYYLAGKVGIGTNRPDSPLHVESSVNAPSARFFNRGSGLWSVGVEGASYAETGRGVFGFAGSTTGDNAGVYGQTSSDRGKAVRGWASAAFGWTYGGLFEAVSPLGCGVQGESPALGVRGIASASGGEAYGVHGRTPSTEGYGVYGEAIASSGYNVGVYGISRSSTGRGVVGNSPYIGVLGATDASSGFAYGGWFESGSTDGRGVLGYATASSGTTFGVYGRVRSPSGIGVVGEAMASSGSAVGGEFVTHSQEGIGVAGIAYAEQGNAVGGYFSCASDWGYGILAVAGGNTATKGIWVLSQGNAAVGVAAITNHPTGGTVAGLFENSSTSGTAVHGIAKATSGTTYGVYGQSNSPNGYGVFSRGRFAATGTKSFQIDHPLHPENAVLNHFSAEGPEPYNIYRGTVVLDARGEAWVLLPDYFEAINRDPSYHLTAIGAPMPNLHVAVEIQNNRFKIAGGAPGKKVSWEVKAIRNDRWVQEYGYHTEQPKTPEHRGKYLHPELYGQPKELGIHYRPEQEQELPMKK